MRLRRRSRIQGRACRALLAAAVLVATLAGIAVKAAQPVIAAGEDLAIVPVIETGLSVPTAVEIAPDGRIVVAEKAGRLKVFDGPYDNTPVVAADLRTRVDSQSDRGLLGLALDPGWPENAYAYVLYTRDAPPGQAPPVWNDECPTPPGINTDGCVVTGTLARIEIGPDGTGGAEQRLIDGAWCQQFSSHSVADLSFGPDGALYVSAGEGAWYNNLDYGQYGGTLPGTPTPANPCDDPPGDTGTALSAPTSEGGALRAQDINTPGDPTGFHGAIIRVDPATGQPLPDNPRMGNADPTDDAYVAYGLRNPFRIAHRPGTEEIWIADVGWSRFEEIDRLVSPRTQVQNFGWPCFEGTARQPTWDSLNVNMCENLYSGVYPAPTPPANQIAHPPPFTGNCKESVVLTGINFYEPGPGARLYPDKYHGGIFWTDYQFGCLWFAPLGTDGQPDFSATEVIRNLNGIIDIERGPDGDLYLLSYYGQVSRLRAAGDDQAPVPQLSATPTSGFSPLEVSFSAAGTTDPENDPLVYSWDLDGDGRFGDAYGETTTSTYTSSGNTQVGLRVSDGVRTAETDTSVFVNEGAPPRPVIDAPLDGSLFRADRDVTFAGSASDADEGVLGADRMRWDLYLASCPDTSCGRTLLAQQEGVDGGTFGLGDYGLNLTGGSPPFLQIDLTVTDGAENRVTVRSALTALTTDLSLQSVPAGVPLTLDGIERTTVTLVSGTGHEIGAPPTATIGGVEHAFSSWVGGGEQNHVLTASAAATSTATAVYVPVPVATDAVLATDDEAWTLDDDELTIWAGANDVELFGRPLSLQVVSPPAGGSASFDELGRLVYRPSAVPAAPFDDTIAYRACNNAEECDDATVTVHVTPRPVAVADSVHLSSLTPPRTAVIEALANDSDPGGTIDPTSLRVSRSPLFGRAVASGDSTIAYEHVTRFGPDTAAYSVCAIRPAPVGAACTEGEISLMVNGPPAATDDYLGGATGTTFALPVLDNDPDPGGLDPSSISVVTPPGQGNATVDPDAGVLVYEHTGVQGVDQLRYRVCDSDTVLVQCAEADAYVATNRPPTAEDDTASASIGIRAKIPVVANDSDPDDDSLKVAEIVEPGTLGYASPANRELNYIAFSEAGTDTVRYRVCDEPQFPGYENRSFRGAQQCDDATVTITVTEPGILRVETVPPVPTRISLNGEEVNRWGIDWMKVAAGPAQVCFSDVEGLATPGCVDAVVAPGETAAVRVTFEKQGFLRVVTDPPVPGAIAVDGVVRDGWGLWTEFAPGPHEVCFGPVGGLTPPACQTVEVVAEQTTTVSGTYAQTPGQTGPEGVGFLDLDNVESPAHILVDGVTRDSRQLTLLPLAVGEHEICTGDAVGFETPSCEPTYIEENSTASHVLAPSPTSVVLATTDPAGLPVTFNVSGRNYNAYRLDIEVPLFGFVFVCASDLPGFDGPAEGCQPATAEPSPEPLSLVFTYVPQPPPEPPP